MTHRQDRGRMLTNAQVWYIIISASIIVFLAVMSLFD